MSRGKGRAADSPANASPSDAPKDLQSEETQATQEEATAQDMVADDPYGKLDGMTANEAIASPIGAPDQYPYLDKTAMPLHERNLPMTTDAGGPSQAELNPAFYPKAEDGGPTTANDEGIGTEPNVNDQMLASAAKSGVEGAVEQTEEQIAEGQKQQMDAEGVTAAAQERAPDGVDGATGQPEGQATPAGAPSGMEKDSQSDSQEQVPVAGADGDPSDSDEDNAKTPGADNS